MPTPGESEDRVGEGFEIIVTGTGGPTLRLARWSQDAERALGESQASNVIIDPFWKGPGSDLGFLQRFARQVRRIEVGSAKMTDLSALEAFPNLEELALECPVDSLDFRRLPVLRKCLLAQPATLGNVQDCASLVELALFDLRLSNLAGISSLSSLRRLSLHHLRQLTSLDGIQQLSLDQLDMVDLTRLRSLDPATALRGLRALNVTGCRRIMDLPAIQSLQSLETLSIFGGPQMRSLQFLGGLTRLRELGIWNTQIGGEASLSSLKGLPHLRVLKLISVGTKVRDIQAVGQVPTLEVLFLDRGPPLPSLAFLQGLKSLRELAISRTEIGDGNLQVLLELPRLERIHRLSPHRKHYSHRLEELDPVLHARHPDRPSGPQPNTMQETVDRLLDRAAGDAQRSSSHMESALADSIRKELIAHFGSWDDLFDAVASELKTVAKEKRFKDRFSECITLAGRDITVMGRMVRGRASIEMIRFTQDDK